MSHIHKFQLDYGAEKIKCDIDMDVKEMTGLELPSTMTPRQQQLISSLFSMLMTVHKEFYDYQKLKCNEVGEE